jgi:hypothetical protein
VAFKTSLTKDRQNLVLEKALASIGSGLRLSLSRLGCYQEQYQHGDAAR